MSSRQGSRSGSPGTASVRTRPSRTLASLYARPHYMGDHPLFHNAVTAKRFPALANVPSDELAAMFSVDPVDKEATQREELMFHEEHRDKPVPLRDLPPLPPGAPAFRPSNSGQARRQISNAFPSVFTGFDADRDREERFKAEQARERDLRVSRTPFSRGATGEAQKRIARTEFLYSLDETASDMARKANDRRRREQQAQGVRDAYGYAGPQSRGSSRGGQRY